VKWQLLKMAYRVWQASTSPDEAAPPRRVRRRPAPGGKPRPRTEALAQAAATSEGFEHGPAPVEGGFVHRLILWGQFVKFSHTIFALPFALAAMAVSARENHGWPGWRAFLLVLACFLFSGFAALLYETAWMRQFSIVFGTSELAVAAVLGAYMAGLAVGAAGAARFVARIRRPGGPLLAYLAAEVFAHEPREVEILVRTVAPLERFTAPLCEALGVQGAAETVRALARRGLFVELQGHELEWYALTSPVREFALAEDVVLHRIRLTYEALAEGISASDVLASILRSLT